MALLGLSLSFARFASADRVMPGISVAGADVGGLDSAELRRELTARAAELAQRPVTLQLGSRRAVTSLDELGITASVSDSARRALAVGRTEGWFGGMVRYLSSAWARQALPAALRVDRARFDATLARLESSLIDDPPRAGCVRIEAGAAVAAPPRAGRELARDEALGALTAAAAGGELTRPVALRARPVTPELSPGSLERALAEARRAVSGRVTLESGTRRLTVEPDVLGSLLTCEVEAGEPKLSLDRSRFDAWLLPQRSSLEAPARDAGFEVSPEDEVKVVPGAAGVKLEAEGLRQALWAAAQSEQRRAELPLKQEPLPGRTTEQAEKLAIVRLVGAFTTRHPCCQPRVDNIHRVAQLLDGLVVEPGQQVSVNAIVGPRTLKNGFVAAPSIEDGEMVDTIGGGVSQFATTLFNALFRAGYEIIERKPHTYWFPRYPMGIEATLSWPHPDIVFKNDSASGLLVKTSFTDTSITVKLYGNSDGRRVVTRVSERREIVQPAVELLPNRAVPPDEEKVKEGGMIGWSVLVERTVTYADGTKREDKRKVTYRPKPRRVDVHPCRIPRGEPGATGEPCPEVEPPPSDEASSEAAPQAG